MNHYLRQIWAARRFCRSTENPSGKRGIGTAGTVVVLILIGWLVGCSSVRSKAEVAGLYELSAEGQKISLEVFPNETFAETIVFAGGRVEKRAGRWHWAYGRMSFQGLWVPESFAPDYIRRADSGAGSGQPKYTDPGHWSIKAERHWGTVVLPIFPDADINFAMVRHSPAQ
jgi:hypothetical protein